MHACNEIRHSYEGKEIIKKAMETKIKQNKKGKFEANKRLNKTVPKSIELSILSTNFFMSSILTIFSFRFMYVCDASFQKCYRLERMDKLRTALSKTTHFSSFNLLFYPVPGNSVLCY